MTSRPVLDTISSSSRFFPEQVIAEQRINVLQERYNVLITRRNEVNLLWDNGVFSRFKYPVLTNEHIPLEWRYDLNVQDNPFMMERLGVNAVFNPGAIEQDGKLLLMARVEGNDRKSFFALAESTSGVDGFCFRPEPVAIPGTDSPDINVYDMRLTRHEDGWIYGLFCTERKDPSAPEGDTSAAEAQCGIVRSRDLCSWERLPDLKTPSPQQRNVVLHPEFVNGRYMLYTRPQDGFINAGSGGGIGYGFCSSLESPVIDEEKIVDSRIYHTVKEVKNGQGPSPLKTPQGWIHLAHGVRNTATGLRYVLYLFMTDLREPWRVTYIPGGHFLAAWGDERVGDLSNIVFSNGWVACEDGTVFIYYASGDTKVHVAVSSLDRLLDYVLNTPEDPLLSAGSVQQRLALIRKNMSQNIQ